MRITCTGANVRMPTTIDVYSTAELRASEHHGGRFKRKRVPVGMTVRPAWPQKLCYFDKLQL